MWNKVLVLSTAAMLVGSAAVAQQTQQQNLDVRDGHAFVPAVASGRG